VPPRGTSLAGSIFTFGDIAIWGNVFTV
jgi:hypothetical protein